VAYSHARLKTLYVAETGDLAAWDPPVRVDPDVGTGNGSHASAAYDSQGNLGVSYRRCTQTVGVDDCTTGRDDALMFAYRVNGEWSLTEVDTGGVYHCGMYTSLVFTDDDVPVIAYQCKAETVSGVVATVKVAWGRRGR
jgi:hypothetical protein